jgi:chromosome segregation protein
MVLSTAGKESFNQITADFDATVDVLWPTDSTISQESIGRLETQGCENLKPLIDVIRVNNDAFATRLQKILNGFFVVDNLTAELASKINPEIQFKGLVSKDGSVLIKKVGNSVLYGLRHNQESEAQGIVARNNLIQQMGEELEVKQASLTELEAKLAETEIKLSETRSQLEEKTKEFNEVNTLHAATKAALESKEANQSSNASRLQILITRKNETSKLRLELNESDETLLLKKEEMESAVRALAEEVEDLESRHHELKMSFEAERDEMMELKVKAQSYQQQLTSLASQVEDVNSQIDRYREKQTANLELLENYETEIENGFQEVESVEASNREAAEVLAETDSSFHAGKRVGAQRDHVETR